MNLFRINYFQKILLGFAVLILFGAILLMLPIASNEGVYTPFLKARFTSTSASCVTGIIGYSFSDSNRRTWRSGRRDLHHPFIREKNRLLTEKHSGQFHFHKLSGRNYENVAFPPEMDRNYRTFLRLSSCYTVYSRIRSKKRSLV